MDNPNLLKPCPFCGGKAKIYTSVNDKCTACYAYIFCTSCDSRTSTFYDNSRDGIFMLKAIDAWNKRFQDSVTVKIDTDDIAIIPEDRVVKEKLL